MQRTRIKVEGDAFPGKKKRKKKVVHVGGAWRGISTRDSLACNESEAAYRSPYILLHLGYSLKNNHNII